MMSITDDDVHFLYFKQGSTKDRVFAVYIYFTKHTDEEVCQKAITGLGTLIHRFCEVNCSISVIPTYNNLKYIAREPLGPVPLLIISITQPSGLCILIGYATNGLIVLVIE